VGHDRWDVTGHPARSYLYAKYAAVYKLSHFKMFKSAIIT